MVKKTPITLSITTEIMDKYRKYCEKYGMIISKRVEILIEKDMKKPFDELNISLCKSCGCMTKTDGYKCGKCGGIK